MKTMIVVDNLSFSEKNYCMINEVNQTIDNSITEVSVAIMNFSEKVINTKFAIMNATEIDGFDNGVLIAIDLNSAKDILSSRTNSKKVFYVWDIEWFYRAIKYVDICSVLQNEELTIITKSKKHKEIIERLTNNKVEILKNFELEKIWNLLKNTEKE